MKNSERFWIGPGLRSKLREVITRVDGMAGGSGGTSIPVRLQGMQRGGGGAGVRLGRISGTWNKEATATVEELGPSGEPLDPPEYFEAKNWFTNIDVSGGYKKVACGLARGAWILIAAECD